MVERAAGKLRKNLSREFYGAQAPGDELLA